MDRRERALALWREAEDRLDAGDFRAALALAERSLGIDPTAEAHTWRGAALSGLGRLDEAIAACEAALVVDPGYGNAANDLGAYHALQGRTDEAIAWFERARDAPRSDAPENPCLNLGRLHARAGRRREAAREFRRALERNPGDPVALLWLERLAA